MARWPIAAIAWRRGANKADQPKFAAIDDPIDVAE
jgi:hypothetical protein